MAGRNAFTVLHDTHEIDFKQPLPLTDGYTFEASANGDASICHDRFDIAQAVRQLRQTFNVLIISYVTRDRMQSFGLLCQFIDVDVSHHDHCTRLPEPLCCRRDKLHKAPIRQVEYRLIYPQFLV
jgi:hypothetical protein